MTKPKSKTCAACAFYQPDPHSPDKSMGNCRRLPPTVAGHAECLDAMWPGVWPYDWCGEHQPKRGRQLLGDA